MKTKVTWLIAMGLLSMLVLISSAQTGAQKRKPVFITRLYTGPDGQTHVEEIEAKFTTGNPDVFKLMAISGAELHRAKAGNVSDWHTAPHRQYVITLSGRGEFK